MEHEYRFRVRTGHGFVTYRVAAPTLADAEWMVEKAIADKDDWAMVEVSKVYNGQERYCMVSSRASEHDVLLSAVTSAV